MKFIAAFATILIMATSGLCQNALGNYIDPNLPNYISPPPVWLYKNVNGKDIYSEELRLNGSCTILDVEGYEGIWVDPDNREPQHRTGCAYGNRKASCGGGRYDEIKLSFQAKDVTIIKFDEDQMGKGWKAFIFDHTCNGGGIVAETASSLLEPTA